MKEINPIQGGAKLPEQAKPVEQQKQQVAQTQTFNYTPGTEGVGLEIEKTVQDADALSASYADTNKVTVEKEKCYLSSNVYHIKQGNEEIGTVTASSGLSYDAVFRPKNGGRIKFKAADNDNINCWNFGVTGNGKLSCGMTVKEIHNCITDERYPVKMNSDGSMKVKVDGVWYSFENFAVLANNGGLDSDD